MTTIASSYAGEETDQTTYFGAPIVPTESPADSTAETHANDEHEAADAASSVLNTLNTSHDSTAGQLQSAAPQSAGPQSLCPFCGEFNTGLAKPCSHCNLEDTIEMRAAATQRSGHWFVRDPHLALPGVEFSQLQSMIREKVVTAKSIVRGPATGQLWRVAATIRGISREFGQCHACGGQIEPTEITCPHCERLQTLQEYPSANRAEARVQPTAPSPSQTPSPSPSQAQPQSQKQHDLDFELEFTPETAGQARAALLNEPMVRIHSLSHPEEFTDLEDLTVRPVVAECSERHVPKDDLLTPQDLAKAFQLEFGMRSGDPTRPFKIPGQITRQIKFVLSGTAALAIACLVTVQGIHLLAPATAPARYIKPIATTATEVKEQPTVRSASADARLASELAFATPPADPQPSTPLAIQAPAVQTPEPKPTAPSAIVVQTPVTQTPAAQSPAAQSPAVQSTAAQPPLPAPVAVRTEPAKVALVPKINKPVSNPIVTQVMLQEPVPVTTEADNPNNLLKAGIAAEANGNYAAAIRFYERIQSLPGDQWPPSLKTRLKLAQEELKGDLH
jgi:uncharacterized Zn finger protein (UPF0148 family)